MKLYLLILIFKLNLYKTYCNNAEGLFSGIFGGRYNLAYGDYSLIGSGSNNSVLGDYSVIFGGSDNRVFGSNSYALGTRAKSEVDNTVTISLTNSCINQDSDSFKICAKNGLTINNINIEKTLDKLNKTILLINNNLKFLENFHKNTTRKVHQSIFEKLNLHNKSIEKIHKKVHNNSQTVEIHKQHTASFIENYNTNNKSKYSYFESHISNLQLSQDKIKKTQSNILNQITIIHEWIKNNSNASLDDTILIVESDTSEYKTLIIVMLTVTIIMFLINLGIIIDTRKKIKNKEKVKPVEKNLGQMAANTLPLNDTDSASTNIQTPKKRSRRIKRLPKLKMHKKNEQGQSQMEQNIRNPV